MINLVKSAAGRAIASGPTISGVSRGGGECYSSGLGIDWHMAAIRRAFPEITDFQARILCAGSIVMSAGIVRNLRRARLTKRGGYTLTFHPLQPIGSQWTRSGELAGPQRPLP